MIIRHGVQFRWENRGYRDFADFLAAFNHDKRKKVKQERRRVADAGIAFTRKVGAEITAADWAFFHRCYDTDLSRITPRRTCTCRSSSASARRWPDNAAAGDRPPRRRADLRRARRLRRETLWGRYWGATEYVPGLHFEACYYQAIEFCIERGIAASKAARRACTSSPAG